MIQTEVIFLLIAYCPIYWLNIVAYKEIVNLRKMPASEKNHYTQTMEMDEPP